MSKKSNIAIVHLVSNGDILYATAIARQIKEVDYPNCHLTWYVASSYMGVLENNPYIDRIIGVPCSLEEALSTCWESTKSEVLIKKEKGIYDEVFFTQILPDNLFNYDGVIRTSIFNNYPFKMNVPINPILVLRMDEISNVKKFIFDNNIEKYENVIIFECSPNSQQSFVNKELALIIAEKIIKFNSNTCVILSSPHTIDSTLNEVIDASKLSFRENAELIKYCTLLIGCSSGITWLSTSINSKFIPTLQLLNSNSESIFASVKYDLEYFKQDTSSIIEITNQDTDYILDCINKILNEGVDKAKLEFDEILKPILNLFFDTTFYNLLKQRELLLLKIFLINYIKRNRFVIYILSRIIKIIIDSFKFKVSKILNKL